MPEPSASRPAAVAQALFVTFLWSTSWVLIKIGLEEMPPILFAGLRYGLATLVLLPWVVFSPARRARVAALGRSEWRTLCGLGIVLYALTQGAQFVALAAIPAATLSLVLSCTPVVVAVLSVPLLGERPTRLQVVGALLLLVGAALFLQEESPALEARTLGLVAAAVGLAANAGASFLGRHVNRSRPDVFVVTTLSMAVGSGLLLGAGLVLEGPPRLEARSWAIIAWLAVVNTAFAFTLWNRTLRQLSATESSVVNNTMLIQIAVLAWIFLGETITPVQVVGLATAAAGVLLVQLRR